MTAADALEAVRAACLAEPHEAAHWNALADLMLEGGAGEGAAGIVRAARPSPSGWPARPGGLLSSTLEGWRRDGPDCVRWAGPAIGRVCLDRKGPGTALIRRPPWPEARQVYRWVCSEADDTHLSCYLPRWLFCLLSYVGLVHADARYAEYEDYRAGQDALSHACVTWAAWGLP